MRRSSDAGALAGVFLFGAFIFGGGMAVTLTATKESSPVTAAVASAVAAVVFGLVFAALIRASWRRAGGREALVRRSRAIRLGALPADADSTWIPGLRARLQNALQARWLYPGVTLVFTFVGLSRLKDPLAAAYFFGLALLALVLTATISMRSRRTARTIDRFIAELESHET